MVSSLSRNICLATITEFLECVPFEILAKFLLLVVIFLFVIDPIPPYSQFIIIVLCILVLKLNLWHCDTIIAEQYHHEQQSMEIIVEH